MEDQTQSAGLLEDSERSEIHRDETQHVSDNPNTVSSDSQPLNTSNVGTQPEAISSTEQQHERHPDNSIPNVETENQSEQAQAQARPPSEGGQKSKIQPHEAIRRGLSFGPIKKPGSRHNSTTGILKTKSKSPSSRLFQRSLSASSEALSSQGVGCLKKDRYEGDADEEVAIDTSDDEPTESSGDETSITGRVRGRRRGSETGQRTTPKSPLAGSVEKPTVTVSGPDGERQPSAKRFVVHPNTNFDRGVSRPPSPNTSDSEELNDIRRAQKLNINSSPIDSSVPHRLIQTIIRGDFASMQEEAKEGSRRLRTYLVATDLSAEAAYALEWTIGTVLRDGDTLLAVYAVDEEVGTGVSGDCLPIGEGAKAIEDTTAVMERMTVASQKGSLMSFPTPLSKASFRPSSRKSSAATSTDSRALSKAEQERSHAIEQLLETCLRFLRKTKLQVRIAIEVIHCKSPKYMITEAVGFLPPPILSLVC